MDDLDRISPGKCRRCPQLGTFIEYQNGNAGWTWKPDQPCDNPSCGDKVIRQITRRAFATTLLGLMAAPLIVRASSIMPVRADNVWVPKPWSDDDPRLIAARFDGLGVNPVYEIGPDGTVTGSRHVDDTWDTWQGEVLDLRQ